MNHIYKVIWNHAKHCYTVVSEIAKNHSTSSVTKKKVSIAVILAAGMLSGFSPMVSGAADTTAVVYNEDKTSMKSTNSGSVGKNAIALGKGASAVDDSIAIGNGAYTQNGTLTYGQSVALGNGAVTGAKSTSIGNNAIGGREGTITIGANAKNEVLYATIVGTDSTITSDGTAYMLNLPLFGEKPVNVQGAVSTSYGAHNTITNEKEVFSGVANSIIGSVNTVTNSNGVTIQGTGNTVTGAYKNMNLNDSDFKKLFLGGNYSVLKEKESGAIAIIGGANTISSQTSSTVIGFGNTLEGKNSTGVFTAGSHNKLTNVSNSLVMGDNNTLEGRKNVISLGNNNTVTANDAVAIGNGAKVEAEGGVAIGVGSVADRVASKPGAAGAFAPADIPENDKSIWMATQGAVSVGNAAEDVTRQITGVAAGSEATDAVNVAQLNQVNSKAETAQAEAAKGWNITTDGSNATKVAPGDTVLFAGDSNISVSNNGKDVRVKLKKDLAGLTSVTTMNAYVTNVDASRDDSVTNVEYVKSQIADAALSAGDGISISDKKINVKLKDGEENLAVDKTGLSMKKDLTGMQSITGAGGGKISFADGNVTVNQNTFASDGRIQNVAAGTADSDAVNYGQLKAVNETAAKGWNVSTNSGTATKVAPGETVDFAGDSNISLSNNGKHVKVELNKDIDVNSVQTNALNSKYNLSVGTANENGIMPFFVNSTGDFYAAHNKFHVDKDGKVTATAGEIGNVVLQNGVYYGHSTLQDGSLLLTDDNGNHSYIDAKGAKLGKVTVAEDGKISNVTAGVADTDAVNVGQLKEAVEAGNTDTHIKPGEYGVGADNTVNMDVVDKNGNKVDTVTIKDVAKASDVGDVNNIASDIKNQDGSHTTVVAAVNNLNNKVGDLNYVEGGKGNYVTNGENTTTSIGKLDKALKDVADTAAKHTKVEGSSNITVTNTAKEGEAANYKVELNKDIDVDTVKATTVTTGQTVMNNDGLKVGENVSVTGTTVTAGQASISNEGLAVGPNTSLKADELKVDGKTYIDKDGLNANGQHITNVKAGEADTDAVNYGQLKDTNNHIDRVENQVANNTNRINNLDNRVNKVGAGAAALAALHPLDFDPDDKWDFAAGYGNYSGASAVALGAYYRPNEDTMFSVGGSFGNGENMVNAGVSLKLGQSNHTPASKAAMEKKISALSQEVEELKAAIADLRAAQTKAKDATEKDAQKK